MLRLQSNFLRQTIRPNLCSYSIFTSKLILANYSTATKIINESTENIEQLEVKDEHLDSTVTKTDSNLPWYLQLTKQRDHTTSTIQREPIELPDNSPSSLLRMANFLKDKQGLEDIVIFDMRQYDGTIGKMADFMVIASAKSIKHCQSSYIELNKMIKQEFKQTAYVEGNINQNEARKRSKRLLRRNNIGGVWKTNKRNENTHDTNDAWYMIDTRTDNIFINMITENRRKELNLEELYAPENEKFKWTRAVPSEPIDEPDDINYVNDENNVLAGLRRLAEQRRRYSTTTSNKLEVEYIKELNISLKSNNLEQANNIIDKELNRQTNYETTYFILKCIHNSLAEINVNDQDKVNVNDWKDIFDKNWPITLPVNNKRFWDLRFKYLELLNMVPSNIKPANLFLDDYFRLKLLSGLEVSKDDLLNFLKTTVKRSDIISSKRGKLAVVKSQNQDITNILKLYVGTKIETRILHDDEAIYWLLKSMIVDDKTKLASFQRVIDRLATTPQLSQKTTITVIDILAESKLWNELFKFWKNLSLKIESGNDKRPWKHYIQVIINSKDKQIIERFIENGNLLWLIRYGVDITPDMKKQLKKLFSQVDSSNTKFERSRIQFGL